MQTFTIPWNRYALIPELAKKLDGVSPQFGKTVLQKLVFLLQEIYGLNCGYDFRMYTYGPFDSQLLSDLDLVESWGCVKIEPVGSAGYNIAPAGDAKNIRDRARDFLDSESTQTAMRSLIQDYGRKSAKDLELRTTLISVAKKWNNDTTLPERQELYDIVHEIKPRFSETEMNSAIDELLSLGHIKLAG